VSWRASRLGWVLLAILLACGPGAEAPEEGAATRAPEFSLEDLSGRMVSLSGLRGRPVVVDFWATWCAPCVHQIPVLNDFQAANPEVVVMGISVDAGGLGAVAPFAEEHGIAYTVLLGDESLAQQYGAFGFPSLYVIDREGAIASAHVGVVRLEELENSVAALGSP